MLREIPSLAVQATRNLSKMPHNLMGTYKYLAQHFRSAARTGSEMERITAIHPNPKLAALGQAFEEMLGHPLTKRFRRNRIALYLQKTEEALGKPEIISAAEQAMSSPGLAGMKSILIPQVYADTLSLEELKSFVGHEIGHHLRADGHPRRGLGALSYLRISQESEKMADQIGVVLANEPEAAKTGLDKIFAYQKEGVERFVTIAKRAIPDRNKITDRIKKAIDTGTEYFTNKDSKSWIYPSTNQRKQMIDALAQRITTREGRSFVEAEIARKLETEHRKLFPHHYNRPGGVTRGE